MNIMNFSLENFIHSLSSYWLVAFALLSVFVLVKSADYMVEEVVYVSSSWGMSKVLIGATVVSIGTTLPEVCISVFAAFRGQSGIALGNAIGSVICDTGLVLGLACLLGKIPIDYKNINRQCWIQLLSAFMLVVICFMTRGLSSGLLPQYIGFLFIGLFLLYIYKSLRWARNRDNEEQVDSAIVHFKDKSVYNIILGLLCAFALLALSSEVLISTVSTVAKRMNVPESIIAVTCVALGTSLPELSAVISAVRKGHGDIALGNVIGADILNILLVAGASAAVTKPGLIVEEVFYTRLFPVMMLLLFMVRFGTIIYKKEFSKFFGATLLLIYLALTVVNILIPIA
jgi:cation:H+ antiporter